MSTNGAKCGSLKIYKAGGKATTINLLNTTYSIGSDAEANLMLRIDGVEPFHCEIHVLSDGLAMLLNKAMNKPVPINGIIVPSKMYLMSNDTFSVMGKEFKYENENLSPELIEKAKKANLAFLRKWNRKTATIISLTPQPLPKTQARVRRSSSLDNPNIAMKKKKFDKGSKENVYGIGEAIFPSKPGCSQRLKGFTVCTPEGIKPSSRNATMLNMCQTNYKEPECDEPAPSSRDKARTPVQFETENDVTTPLNNESIVVIGTPEEERPSLRSIKTRAKDISLQRLTANDDSAPDSKTPKSALKSDKKQTPKSCLRRSKKLADEFLQLSNKQLAFDGSTVNRDTDTCSKLATTGDCTLEDNTENVKPADVCEETFCDTPAKRKVHFTDDTLNESNSEDFMNSLPTSSTPFKVTALNKQVEAINEELSGDSDNEPDVVIGIKRKRVSYSSEDDACVKRQQKHRDTDYSEIHSFNISEHHTDDEDISSALQENDDTLNTSTDSVSKTLEDKQIYDSNESSKLPTCKSSRSANLENEPAEDIINESTLESVDTSSILFIRNNVSFEDANFSPLKSSEVKICDTGAKTVDATPPSTNKSMVVSPTPEKNETKDGAYKQSLALNESGIEALQYDEDDIFPKKPALRTYERTPKKSLNTSLSNQSKVAEWIKKTTPLTVKSGVNQDDTFQFDDLPDGIVDDQPTFISEETETDGVRSGRRHSRIRGRSLSSKSIEQPVQNRRKTINALLNINESSETEEFEMLNLQVDEISGNVEETSIVNDDQEEPHVTDQVRGVIDTEDTSFSVQKRPPSMNRPVQLDNVHDNKCEERHTNANTTSVALSEHSIDNEPVAESSAIMENTRTGVEDQTTDIDHCVSKQSLILSDTIEEQTKNNSVINDYKEEEETAAPIMTQARSLRNSYKNTNEVETAATGKRRGVSLYYTKNKTKFVQSRRTIGSLSATNTTMTEINNVNSEKEFKAVKEDINMTEFEDVPVAKKRASTPKAQKRTKNDLSNLERVKEFTDTPLEMEKKSKPADTLDKTSTPKTRLRSTSRSKSLIVANAKFTPSNRRKTTVALHVSNVGKTKGNSEPLNRVAGSAKDIDSAEDMINSCKNDTHILSESTEISAINGELKTSDNESEIPDVKQNISGRKSLRQNTRARSLLKPSTKETQELNNKDSDKEEIVIDNINTDIELPDTKSNGDSQDKPRGKREGKNSRGQIEVKNDLTDVRGVKQLMATPKYQKQPKNDLSDLRGVKNLLATPKVRNEPNNDLSDLRGVKVLLGSPKIYKQPKNDLSDLKGVKALMTTPKVQKQPKNDLSDIKGVKVLLTTPKTQKPPTNDLTDVEGVQELFETPPAVEKSNNSIAGGRKLRTPKVRKEPQTDLSDAADAGIVEASQANDQVINSRTRLQRGNKSNINKNLNTPKLPEEPDNDLAEVARVDILTETPPSQTTQPIKNSRTRSQRKNKRNMDLSSAVNDDENTIEMENDGIVVTPAIRTTRSRKRKETEDHQPVNTNVKAPTTRSRRKKNSADDSNEDHETIQNATLEVSDVKPRTTRAKKNIASQNNNDSATEKIVDKIPTRGRKAKKIAEEPPVNLTVEENAEKPITRGKRGKKIVESVIDIDNSNEYSQVEKPSNSRATAKKNKLDKPVIIHVDADETDSNGPSIRKRARKVKETHDDNVEVETPVTKPKTSSKRAKKDNIEDNNDQIEEAPTLKSALKTRRTKKDIEKDNANLIKENNVNQSPEITQAKPSTRSKTTKKVANDEKPTKKGKGRNSSSVKKIDTVLEDTTAVETITETKHVSGVPITKISTKKVGFVTAATLLATPAGASKKRRLHTEEEINTSLEIVPELRRSARRH